MGKPSKMVHTPEPARLNSLSLAGARIAEVKRVDAEAGSFKFHVSGPLSGLEALCKKMGWNMPGDKTTLERLEGKLLGGQLVFSCQDKLIDAEIDIEYKELSGFELHRLELEQRKGKGFRRELRFSGTFKCVDGAANFESYMTRTNNSRGTLKVTYLKQEVQDALALNDGQLNIPDDVHATTEQRKAVTN